MDPVIRKGSWNLRNRSSGPFSPWILEGWFPGHQTQQRSPGNAIHYWMLLPRLTNRKPSGRALKSLFWLDHRWGALRSAFCLYWNDRNPWHPQGFDLISADPAGSNSRKWVGERGAIQGRECLTHWTTKEATTLSWLSWANPAGGSIVSWTRQLEKWVNPGAGRGRSHSVSQH